MPATQMQCPLASLPSTVGSRISESVHEISVRAPLQIWPFARFVMPSSLRTGTHTAGKSSSSRGFVSISALISSRMPFAASSAAPMTITNFRCAYRGAQSAAPSQIEVLPLPRGMASAKRPPPRTLRWMRSMTRRWSLLHSSANFAGKYVSRKSRRSRRHRSRRAGSTTAGMAPMSRPLALCDAWRLLARSFRAS